MAVSKSSVGKAQGGAQALPQGRNPRFSARIQGMQSPAADYQLSDFAMEVLQLYNE
jgi:hypothetical protein